MALVPGTRIGSYEVLALLGAGGMGEVYRAHDGRLGRDVAIKVLPSSLATDADRLRRFEQEARATAALNHPNILAVYDIGTHADTVFVVAELLEGRTLRDVLGDGRVDVKRVVTYAIQIARGLAAAHDKGIVHRDLKPENLFVTTDERLKILDFGLAKVASASSHVTSTALAGSTEPGTIMGTLGYMAPEQVRGGAVDHRADIFSFGAILYELLGGQRAFARDTAADTITAILKETPPDLSSAGLALPPALERVVARCLEKNASHRFQSASDLTFALETMSDPHKSGAVIAATSERPRSAVRRFAAPAAALMLGAALTTLAFLQFQPRAGSQPPQPAMRFHVSGADGLALESLSRASIAPDGRHLAVTTTGRNAQRLTVLSLEDGSHRELADTASYGPLIWSPDSQWIAFRDGAGTALHVVNVDGTRERQIANRPRTPTSGAWSAQGEVVLLESGSGNIVAVPESGGELRVVLKPNPPGDWLSVDALPDGRLLLSRGDVNKGEIVIAARDGSSVSPPLGQGTFARFVRPNHVLAFQAGQIVRWELDPGASSLHGEPLVIATTVPVRQAVAPFSVSESGTLVLDMESQGTRMAWFDRNGREGAALALKNHCRNPEFSPDFGRVALECYAANGNRDVWIYDLARDAADKLTVDSGDDADALWVPDERTIIFASSRSGVTQPYSMSAAGGPATLAAPLPAAGPTLALTPDGREVLLLHRLNIVRTAIGGTGEMRPVVATPFMELEAQFSPDGRFLAYSSNQSDRHEVYVEPWPQTGERWQVSNAGGVDARWSPAGRELFYLAPDRRLMSVAVQPAGALRPARPVELFQSRVAGPVGLGQRFAYAVARDGQRFLMYVADPDARPASFAMLLNWPALVRGQIR